MFYQPQNLWTPQFIALRVVILIVISTTLTISLLDPLLIKYADFSLQNYFALSYIGISQGFFWQLFTYPFLSTPAYGLNFSLILTLFFQMYFFWSIGSELIERYSVKEFLSLFTLAVVVPALFALIPLSRSNSYLLSGFSGPLIAIALVWSMIDSKREVLLFLTLPIQARWLFVGYIASTLLVDLSQGNAVDLVFTLAAICTGHLWAVYRGNLDSLLPSLHCTPLYFLKKRAAVEEKIVPLYRYQAKEEAFLEDVLAKISAQGEKSLTWRERRRLQKISQMRKNR